VFRIAIFFVLLCPLHGLSQAPNFVITNYTVEDGLPSNETYRMIQDRQGYIWIATDRGLTRWDGYEFRVYGVEEGLENISVIHLEMAKNGKLWLCTLGGDLYFYDENMDRLIPYQFNNILQEAVGGHGVLPKFSIHENESIVFSLGMDNPIIKIDSIGNLTNIVNVDELKGDFGFFSIEDETHYSGITNYSKVIGKYNNGDLMYEAKNYYNGQEFPNCPNPNCKGGGVLDGLEYSEEKRVIVLNLSNYFFKNEEYQFCTYDVASILDIKYDDNNAIYASRVYNGGLMYYKDDVQFEENMGISILSNMSIGGLLIDNIGDLWACSLESGIYHIKKNNTTAISNGHVKRIISYKDGLAIIEGANQLKVLNNKYEIVYNNEISDEISGIAYIRNLDLLIILGSRSYYMNKEFKMEKLSGSAYGSRAVEIENNAIVIPLSTGIVIYDYQNGLNENLCRQYYPRRNYDIINFQGSYYIATMEGLYRHPDLHFDMVENHINGLGMRINDLEALEDILLIGSNSQGIFVWDGEKIVDQLTTSDGLLSNSIETIRRYNDEYILVGGKRGISIVGEKDEEFYVVKNITTSYGLPSNNILDLEIVDDQIYYATSSGSGVFTFDISLADSTEVLIDEWLVNKTERKDFVYKSKENNITINYKTLDYRQEGKINYRYRLNEESWTNTRTTIVNYASLSPGKYRFEVQSQNENGIWGHLKIQEFEIAFPWWETWWFRASALLVFFFLSYYFNKRRISAITKDVSIKEEIRQLELQALRAQMNPHFIFNCLTSIQNFIQHNESESAMTYLAKFAKLVRQTLNASSEEIHSLQDELNMLENYLALEQLRFKELFVYEFQIEKGLDPMSISIPPMLMQPLVENSIKHGFQGIAYQGRILISISRENRAVQIAIEDNGKGINVKTLNGKRKSFGSSIAARRLELINLTNAELEVSTPPSGQGTRVSMTIPQ